MKKIISLLIMLVLVISLASCEMLPEELQNTINGLLGVDTHTHDFVLNEKESNPATCLTDGFEISYCSVCNEKQKVEVAAYGHDMQLHEEKIPTNCDQYGSKVYKCTRCTNKKTETIKPIGHEWGEVVEASRLIRCTREGCKGGKLVEPNNKYAEDLAFNFTTEHEESITAAYEAVLAMVNNAAEYDPALHAYAEEGELAEAYKVVDDEHTNLYDLVLYAVGQRQLAEIYYYCDMKNNDLKETYDYMMDYYTNVIATFYSLAEPFYESCYREFFYYGMTEEEIKAYIFDANAVSNPEYTALKERNNAIESEFLTINNPKNDDSVPALYAEFVENNNKMAQLMGYDNYLEYAYENVYGRDYSYADAAEIVKLAKTKGLTAALNTIYDKWNSITGNLSEAQIDKFDEWTDYSFFSTLAPNIAFNDYIDLMAFTSNPDKQISFSDELNKLMADGNMFRGTYEGAFVTSISHLDLPIAYFGKGYDNSFTVAHEFGHYMNEIYNADEFEQSYDLLEMHSQGNELLYLATINGSIASKTFELVETYQVLNMLYVVMSGLAVDSFEQAIYLNSYSGSGAEAIMADGKITYDEYDALYSAILKDLGVDSNLSSDYWRYGMTITSPCYYISYSISAISVLQLYEMAQTDGFDAAKDAYLKLFTYTDVDPEMTTEEVLLYAGMYSYNDEELYTTLGKYFKK